MPAKILTKFTNYHEGIFNKNAGLKVSLPTKFNDLFDAQLRFSDDEIKKLVYEFNNLPDSNLNRWIAYANENNVELRKNTTKTTTEEAIKYYIARLQTTHILCLNSMSAIDFNTSHMWGIYASSGKGIALEFDYAEIDNRFNYTLLKSFLLNFNTVASPSNFLSTSMTDSVLIYVKEFLKESLRLRDLTANKEEVDLLAASNQEVKATTAILEFLIELLNSTIFGSIGSLTNNLIPVTYNSSFDTLIGIFKTYLFLMLSGNGNNKIGFDLVNSFFSNKHNIWQNEHEYRIIVPNYVVQNIEKIEINNGFNEKRANFKRATMELNSFAESLEVKTLKFSKEFQLSAHIDQSNKQAGAMPFAATLPYPTKIYLGWDFKVLNDKKEDITKAAKNIIMNFCKTHSIELYQLNKEVDYTNNRFTFKAL